MERLQASMEKTFRHVAMLVFLFNSRTILRILICENLLYVPGVYTGCDIRELVSNPAFQAEAIW